MSCLFSVILQFHYSGFCDAFSFVTSTSKSEGDNGPCHICQCALALILAIFRRNYDEILHVVLYTGVAQTVFECSRQISE